MTHKFNKIKLFTKKLIPPNIIFPAAYLLLSAEKCKFGETNLPQINNRYFQSKENQNNGLQKSQDNSASQQVTVDRDGTLDSGLLGRGTVLNLGGYICGAFVASDTKEVYIIKLHTKDGWMQLVKPDEDLLSIGYDDASDPRIIKVDYRFLEHLLRSLSKSSDIAPYSRDKEDFWRKIEKDLAWRNIAFYHKKPLGDLSIFKEEAVTSSTAFTKALHQKFNFTNSLISSSLSIRGNIASDSLKDVEAKTFYLVKDKPDLVHLVKAILEGNVDVVNKEKLVGTKEYISCSASSVDDVLQFDAKNLPPALLKLPLEDYKDGYLVLQGDIYYRCIALDGLKTSLEKEREPWPGNYYSVKPLPLISPEDSTAEIPLKELNDEDTIEAKDAVDGQPNDETLQQTNPATDDPKATQPASHNQTVRTSPMGYTGSSFPFPVPSDCSELNASSTDPTPPEKPMPTPPPLVNSNPIPPSPLPPLTSGSNGAIPPPPPQPGSNGAIPPPPLTSGSNGAIPPPPPQPGSNGAIPPPPPPPPIPGPEAGNGKADEGNNDRNKHLKQIQEGMTLKPVKDRRLKQNSTDQSNCNANGSQPYKSPHDQLMESIRKGCKLKKPENNEDKSGNPPSVDEEGLAAVLRRALEAREKACANSDAESDNEDEKRDDEEDWKA